MKAVQGLALAAVVGLLGLLVWKVSHQGGGAAAALQNGKHVQAPGFSLKRIDAGGTLDLASLRGKAVVLNFWASWCLPCKKEAPVLEAASRKFAGRVVFVGIDAQDFTGDARRFARRHGITYPLVHDGPGATLGRYGVTGFPETFFVDRRGRLVGSRVEGAITPADLERNIKLALS